MHSAGGEATGQGLVATATPYDMVYLASFCLDILSGATRTVQVRFDATGTATVRVVGANGTTAEGSIIVRPLR